MLSSPYIWGIIQFGQAAMMLDSVSSIFEGLEFLLISIWHCGVVLSCSLECPHPVIGVLFGILVVSLLVQLPDNLQLHGKTAETVPRSWVPATPVCDIDGALDSWLCHGPATWEWASRWKSPLLPPLHSPPLPSTPLYSPPLPSLPFC